MINLFKKMTVILATSAAIGTLLLVLVFCIPVDRMRQNVATSVDVIVQENEEVPNGTFSHYIQENREVFTDAIMAQNTIEKIPDKNAYEHAMWVYHSDLNPEVGTNWTPEASIKAYCNPQNEQPLFLHEYSRYWHGYLVYLKPLLLLFSWEQVIWIGIIVQLLLMLAVVVLSVRKKQYGVAVVMGLSAAFMKPTLMLVSTTMSVCWVITLLGLLYMLLRHAQISTRQQFPEFFLIIGIVTSYFDFLTYPVVTLGLPLCAWFLLEKGTNLKENIQKCIGYSICWAIGYAGMWGSKWIIADVTLQIGAIRDAAWSIIGRTEAIGGRSRLNGGWYVIGLNLLEYETWYLVPAVLLLLVVLIEIIIVMVKGKMKESRTKLIPLLLIFCIPFAWIIVVQHHSALHARFTFRIIGVAIAALCTVGCIIWRDISENIVRKVDKST